MMKLRELLHETHFACVQRLNENLQPDPERPVLNWTWAKSGQREVAFSDPAFTGYGMLHGRVCSVFDGTDGIDVIFWNFDAQRTARLQAVPGATPDWLKMACFPRSLGWRVPYCASLVALMEQANPGELTREPVKIWTGIGKCLERPAVKWTLKRFRDQERFPEHVVIAWFDPDHDWLPCKIQVMPTMLLTMTAPHEPLPEGSMLFEIAVEQFLDVDDPLIGGSRRFPSVIRDYGVAPCVITVITVRANEPPPRRHRRPSSSAPRIA